MAESYEVGAIRVESIEDREEWDQLVRELGGNPLQLYGWGQIKSETGSWSAIRLAVSERSGAVFGGAQVLVRSVPFPFRQVAYVPRGPFGSPDRLSQIADAISSYLKNTSHAVVVTFEPDIDEQVLFHPVGGVPSSSPIMLPETLVIDLTQSPEQLQSDMTKKCRQYIRKSERAGVSVVRVTDAKQIDRCLEIYDDTAVRSDFALHNHVYYHAVYRELGDASPVYLAEVDGEAVAFLWLLRSSTTSTELYGGAVERGLKLHANHILKWTVMLDQKDYGITRYDMNGLLGEGITQFKKGFASHVDQLHGGVDVPLSPLYPLWAKALPAVRSAMNRIKGQMRKMRHA